LAQVSLPAHAVMQPAWPRTAVSACASPRKCAPVSEHQKLVAASFAHRSSQSRFVDDADSVSGFSHPSVPVVPLGSLEDPRKMASYIEEAERLRTTLPLDDLLAEAEHLEAEYTAKKAKAEERAARERADRQELAEREERIAALGRQLAQTRTAFRQLEAAEAQKLEDFEAAVQRRAGMKARLEELHAELEAKTQARRAAQAAEKEAERAAKAGAARGAEPSADHALLALRREQERVADLLRRQRALDREREQERDVVPEDDASSAESQPEEEDCPEVQAAFDAQAKSLRMAQWELNAARGIAALLA